jgi:hypothetical protein
VLQSHRAAEKIPAASTTATCCVRACGADAPYTPVLYVAQQAREHLSCVRLPLRVCAAHLDGFQALYLTAQRRATMEGALRARGRAAPDWTRTTIEFAGP